MNDLNFYKNLAMTIFVILLLTGGLFTKSNKNLREENFDLRDSLRYYKQRTEVDTMYYYCRYCKNRNEIKLKWK